MSIFNEKHKEAMLKKEYICNECGKMMEFEDEWEEVLICPHCGQSVDVDRYGCEDDEEYERFYPTREELLGIDNEEDNPYGETYEEVCGELSND